MNIKFILEAQITVENLGAREHVVMIDSFDHYPSEDEILQSAKEWMSNPKNSGIFRIDWLQVQKRYFVGGLL